MLVLKIHDISALAKGHPAAAQEALSPMSSAPHRQHDAWTRTLSHAELGPHGSFRLWLFASATHFQVTLASSADDWRFCNLQVNVTYVAQWLDVTAHRPLLEGSINPLLQFLVVSLHFLNQVASTAAESASTEASAKVSSVFALLYRLSHTLCNADHWTDHISSGLGRLRGSTHARAATGSVSEHS